MMDKKRVAGKASFVEFYGMDPWNPLGTGNMLQVLHMGLHVCQMMGYSQINESIDSTISLTLVIPLLFGYVSNLP